MPRREAAMQDLTSTARLFRFGIFELDARSGELRRHGLKIRLPDQSFQILRILLDRPGDVVTRAELQQRLWPSDTFVDFNVGLNSAVRKLREALDDSAENPRFIETLPRRGYRFIASVTPALSDPIPEPASEPEPEREPKHEPAAGGPETARRFFPSWISGGLVVAAAIVALALAYESRWWERIHTGTAAGHIRSLAVLPFENLSGDPAQDYFVDGMTDALTTDLAQVGGLDVISRTSAMQYRDAKKLVPVIGRELNVDALLEGTVIRSGQDVRITAQLVHAATDRHVWAERYEGKLRDVAALQQKIARAVVGAVRGRLAPLRARSAQPIAVDPEAYDAYLKGLTAPGRGSYEGFRTAVAYFEEAVARQPDFAVAYAALAQAQHQFLFGGPLSPRETMPKAEAAARKALELDETLVQAHQTLGGILHHFHWKWEEGDKEFARARELGAQFMEPAGTEALIRNGHFEEAIALTERARSRDPLSFNAYVSVGSA